MAEPAPHDLPYTAPITFLYEDASLAVIDKPPGHTVVPRAGEPASSALSAQVASALGQRVWVVHRLDRETSGVLVFARTATAHRALSMAFESRAVQKTYLALVAGALSAPAGRIEVALHDARRGKSRPAAPGEPGAREACTDYRVMSTWHHGPAAVSLVEARPATGRHHQIRVHLRSIGHPILGDAVYARRGPAWRATLPVPRLALHASTLDLPHPVNGRRLVVDAPLARDLVALVDWLDAGWRRETPS